MPVTESLLDHKVLGREFKRGYVVGLELGRELGLELGRIKGEAKMLRRGLEYRFKKLPKWVDDKLAIATSDQLEEWARRLADRKSLKAIFDRD